MSRVKPSDIIKPAHDLLVEFAAIDTRPGQSVALRPADLTWAGVSIAIAALESA